MDQTEVCPNCKKDIASSKFPTHIGYCRRNIIKCSTCGEMYDKNFLEDHQQQFHITSKCEYCSKKLKKNELDNHSKVCQMKPKYCQYCQLKVPAKDFSLHFKQCQSRTSVCQKCQKSITNKDLAVHTTTCKGKQKVEVNKNQSEFSRLDFNDSLSQFYLKADKQKQKSFKEKQKIKLTPSKPINNSNKNQNSSKNTKIQTEKKPTVDPKSLSRQHFYDNYFQSNQLGDYQQLKDYDFQSTFGQINFNQQDYYNYLPQQSFYGKQKFKGMKSYSYQDKDLDLSTQQQMIQDTLFQSSKKNNPGFKQYLPKDFNSKDIMNGSFYGDILDLQKQQAILEDLSMKKQKRSYIQPKMTKPSVQKTNPKKK